MQADVVNSIVLREDNEVVFHEVDHTSGMSWCVVERHLGGVPYLTGYIDVTERFPWFESGNMGRHAGVEITYRQGTVFGFDTLGWREEATVEDVCRRIGDMRDYATTMIDQGSDFWTFF